MNIKYLINYITTNFPNGCEDTACKNCPLYNANPSTPEDRVCDLLSDLTDDYNNFEE